MTRTLRAASAAASLAVVLTFGAAAQQPAAAPSIHGKPTSRLIVRNAMVIYGNAKPPYGPADIVVENGMIAAVAMPPSAARADANAVVIDGTGKYVMPGIVNAHMHWHDERQPGIPQPIQYERNL
jgi:adenine deaminase